MPTTTTSVLITGGSLNGLTTASLLSARGVPCLVVERHPTTSIQYKFRGISPRSMEIYRGLGLEPEIRAAGEIDEQEAHIARVKNLADPAVTWQGVPWADTSDISPARAAVCDQDRLEPILRAHAERHGAHVRFNTELLDFTQDGDGVTARVRDRASNAITAVRADYLVAADGADSPVRTALGVGRHGPGVLQHWMNVIFETDLPTTLEGRTVRAMFVTEINGSFVPRGDGRWLMAVQYVPERGEQVDMFTHEYCEALIRRAAGRSNVHVRVVDVRPWDAAALVADRFQVGRVFFVGDSAHVMPPTGGFGGNTGIQDAYNLAWKIDAVRRGQAGSQLLETYDSERRPVAGRTMAQSLARLQAWFKDPSGKLPPAEPIRDDFDVIFGHRYAAGAFVADEDDTSTEMFESARALSGRPGGRAPHVMLERDGMRVSSIDLFAGRWVLSVGSAVDEWRDAAQRLTRDTSIPLGVERVDGADGAALIRPDGFVAWRARRLPADPPAALERALHEIVGRPQAVARTAGR